MAEAPRACRASALSACTLRLAKLTYSLPAAAGGVRTARTWHMVELTDIELDAVAGGGGDLNAF